MPKHPKTDEPGQGEGSRTDAFLDEALKATFPASDPLAVSVVDGVKADAPPLAKPKDEIKGGAAKK